MKTKQSQRLQYDLNWTVYHETMLRINIDVDRSMEAKFIANVNRNKTKNFITSTS